MLNIQDNIQVSLKFDGQEYRLDPNSYESIVIVENILPLLPSCKLVLIDTMQFFDSIALSDGLPIEITMGRSSEDPFMDTLKFKVSGIPKDIATANGKKYVIVGVLDHLKYLRGRPLKGYSGSTNEVLAQLAKECGLNYEGIVTSDSMSYLPGNKTYGQFAQYLSDCGYVDENSTMMLGVTDTGTLMYKNITSLPDTAPQPLPYLYQTKPLSNRKNFRISRSSWSKDSGFANMMYGYSYKVVGEGLQGSNEIDKIKFKRNYSNKIDVSTSNLEDIGTCRIEYSPPDCGNYHSNYNSAKYQNKRGRCLYSTQFIPQIENFTGMKLFDVCNIEDTTIGSIDTTTTLRTTYLVTGKTKMITGLQYIEQLLLTTTGRNINNDKLV